MEEKRKKILNWIILIFFIILIINTVLIVLFISNSKSCREDKPSFSSLLQPSKINHSEFYNSVCPDLEMITGIGEEIRLSQFFGDVIVLRFTKFLWEDQPYLLYLKYLYEKFRDQGIHLIFIAFQAKSNDKSIYAPAFSPIPIIDDDGLISFKLNANINDTIIIGRDFKIKFKSNQTENRIIFEQIMRILPHNSSKVFTLADEELSSLMNELSFKDVSNRQIYNLGEIIEDKTALVNLFISVCQSCPVNYKIEVLKEISEQKDYENYPVILLFGKGSDFDMIKGYSKRMSILNSMIVGIIDDSGSLTDKDYYRIFDLNIDPRLFIFQNGKIVFSEDLKDRNKIGIDFLMKNIKRGKH